MVVKKAKKTRLAQMLEREQSKCGMTEKELGKAYGWSQQTFNVWKKGVAPRNAFYAGLARFLHISPDDVAELAAEARVSKGSTKLPDMGAPVMGRGDADGIVFDKYASGFAAPSVAGCYAVRVDGAHMWVNPRTRAADGNTVIIRNGDTGRIATWPADVDDGSDVHVVVLKEMV